MREVATVLPVVKVSGTDYLNTPDTRLPNVHLGQTIDARVVFNPFAQSHAGYDAGEAMRLSPVPSNKNWPDGASAVAKAEGVSFDTFTNDDIEILTAQRRSNFGMWLPIKPTHVAYEWVRQRPWHDKVRIWYVQGTTQIRDTDVRVQTAFKSPNGGGFLKLFLPDWPEV